MRTWRPALAVVAVLFGLVWTTDVRAHFNLNLNVRIFHVEHLDTGLRIHLRTPMPYLVADQVGPVGEDGLPTAAPFTTNRQEEGRVVHFVDWSALNADPLGLGQVAAEGLLIETEGRRLHVAEVALRAYPIGLEPGFATLDEARAAFTAEPAFPDERETYVGDTIVDVLLHVGAEPVYDYAISSSLAPDLPGQEATANLILDHGPGSTNTYRATGLLQEPVVISRSPIAAAQTFIVEGIRHILEGLDHVLFVICLVLGATTLRTLIGRVTGFTIGHTVTLSLGFFGYVPAAPWFIPAVELGIALSIVYAAAIAFFGPRPGGRETHVILVTAAIGLLHGLGFSFVLHEILRVDSPTVWQSLLAFNLGVEIGQIAIVLVLWPSFRLVLGLGETAWLVSRRGIATLAALIATTWAVERAQSIAASI